MELNPRVWGAPGRFLGVSEKKSIGFTSPGEPRLYRGFWPVWLSGESTTAYRTYIQPIQLVDPRTGSGMRGAAAVAGDPMTGGAV